MPLTQISIGPAVVIMTSGADGHLGANNPDVSASMHLAQQVHGADIAEVNSSSGLDVVPGVDGLVTSDVGVWIAVKSADCAPVILVGNNGSVAAVHAGWRGLWQGVVANGVATLRRAGATDITAALGPCIGVECYEFDSPQLSDFVDRWGSSVEKKTSQFKPAFDLVAAVESELEQQDVKLLYKSSICTSCNEDYFSHRRDGTKDRLLTAVCRER